MTHVQCTIYVRILADKIKFYLVVVVVETACVLKSLNSLVINSVSIQLVKVFNHYKQTISSIAKILLQKNS